MNLIELSYYLQNEQAAQEYLQQGGILRTFKNCPYCNSEKIGNIRRDRVQCYKCRKEWHRRKGSFLESRHITYAKFIGFLVLYSKNFGVIEICNELCIDRKNGIALQSAIRKILFRHLIIIKEPQAAILANEKDEIEIKPVTCCSESDGYLLLEINNYKEIGGLYSFLCSSKWIGKKIRNKNLVNSFISFIKMKSISYRGINRIKYLEYLNELVIRFNHRHKEDYEILLQYLQYYKGG